MTPRGHTSIEFWNLHEGATAKVGAQQRFNVVGKVRDPADTVALHARLNGGPWRAVPVNLTSGAKARLCKPGDFNFDGIDIDELAPAEVHLLEMRQSMRDGSQRHRAVSFKVEEMTTADRQFELELGHGEVEEFCQVVDGAWRIVQQDGSPSIAVGREDAGYDRILLFGDRRWTTGYKIEACLTVDAWTHYVHNVGLLFKWNPHRTATGANLPNIWSTGLAYYASTTPGLRLRFGVNVTYKKGVRRGDHVLMEAPRAPWTRIPLWLHRASWYLTRSRLVLSQLRTGVRYRFLAEIHPEAYTLAVWRDGDTPPPVPQVMVERPTELLAAGSVGIIAQNASVHLHSFVVRPVG